MTKNKITADMLTSDDLAKYEIAAELGLLEKVKEGGWKNLTSKESGKIGGLMASRRKSQLKKEKDAKN